MELLVALPFGLMLLFATVAMVIVSIHQSANVTDRVEAIQRGRTTMERVVRQLRSQVCSPTTGAAITAGDANSVTFYGDLTGGASDPERHTITYDPAAKTLTQYDHVGTGTWPNLTFAATPTRTATLLANTTAVSGTPFFTYYAFASNGTVSSTALPSPLSATDLPNVVRVGVSFVSQPRRTAQAALNTTFQSQADVRTADANNPSQGMRCI
jgi:Tfp pilus assembly protein PilW